MKRITNRKYRLGYVAQLVNEKGEVVQSIKCRMKNRFIDLMSTLSLKKGHIYLKVIYGKDQWNDCDAYTMEQALNNLNQYTEKQLLDFVQ